MNIPEMHIVFRQLAQQMGMQNVRAIIPEQIDVLLNASISDKVNQLLREHIAATSDRAMVDNSKIGQANALRSLYQVIPINLSPAFVQGKETRTFVFKSDDANIGRLTTDFVHNVKDSNIPDYLHVVEFMINYKTTVDNLGYSGKNDVITKGGYTVQDTASKILATGSAGVLTKLTVLNPMSNLVESHNFIDYTDRLVCSDSGYADWTLGLEKATNTLVLCKKFDSLISNPFYPTFTQTTEYVEPTTENQTETKWFPVRFIDDMHLGSVMTDKLQEPRIINPVIVTYNNGQFDLFIDKFIKHTVYDEERYTLKAGLIPNVLRMTYIKKPAVVRYVGPTDANNVDCDLPEHLHLNIVKQAVNLYRVAVSGQLYGNQQMQPQQPEGTYDNSAQQAQQQTQS